MTHLLLINPNTTASMTASIAEAARAVAAPGTQIHACQPSFGPASIEGHFDEAIAAAGVAEQVRRADPAPDAVVIACFGDPGLDAAREACAAPVLGIAEAAFHAASMLATGFSVVTTMTRTCVIAERLVQRYGFEHACLAPSPRLLIDSGPRREIMRQKPPLTAGLDHVTQRVEQLPQRVITLRRVFAHQAQIGQQKFPFHIRNIAGIRLPCRAHLRTSTISSR